MATVLLDPATLADRRDLETQWIIAEDLHVDMRYQRPLNQRRVKHIADEWDERACGTLVVNVRHDGTLATVDGQHRLKAFEIVHGPHEKVPCTVFYGLTLEEEAALFAAMNGKNRRSPTPLETFRSRLVSGEEKAHDIQTVIASVGLSINLNNNHRADGIRAIVAVEDIYDSGGREALRETLRTLHEIWGDDRHAYSVGLVSGMFVFLSHFRKTIDRPNFVEKLGSMTPKVLERRTVAFKETGLFRNDTRMTFAHAIREAYNAGKRSRLLPEFPNTRGMAYRKLWDADLPF